MCCSDQVYRDKNCHMTEYGWVFEGWKVVGAHPAIRKTEAGAFVSMREVPKTEQYMRVLKRPLSSAKWTIQDTTYVEIDELEFELPDVTEKYYIYNVDEPIVDMGHGFHVASTPRRAWYHALRMHYGRPDIGVRPHGWTPEPRWSRCKTEFVQIRRREALFRFNPVLVRVLVPDCAIVLQSPEFAYLYDMPPTPHAFCMRVMRPDQAVTQEDCHEVAKRATEERRARERVIYPAGTEIKLWPQQSSPSPRKDRPSSSPTTQAARQRWTGKTSPPSHGPSSKPTKPATPQASR